MRSSRRGNLLLRNPLARGECAVRILFYRTAANFEKKKIFLEILQVFSVLKRIISEEQKTGY